MIQNNDTRCSWNQYALDLAITASKRSEDPFVRVGAAALGHDHCTLGTAYNGLAPGVQKPKSFWKDRDKRRPYMIHAETNMLARVGVGQCKILACTLLPCSSCATNIAAHLVKRVVYRDIYDRDQGALDIFKFYDIECVRLY